MDQEFETNFREVANEEDVWSGVPQGAVLASVLFITMIPDVQEEVKESIVSLFADDIMVST